MGFSTRDEWDEYQCPGAYRLPKRPDEAWPDEWQGWDDWLGKPREYDEARAEVTKLGLRSVEAYAAHAAPTDDRSALLAAVGAPCCLLVERGARAARCGEPPIARGVAGCASLLLPIARTLTGAVGLGVQVRSGA